jgi:large subunit ribosomal protein L24
MLIKKNDTVLIRTGKDKGKRGRVIEMLDGRQKVRVEGVNVVKRHVKAGRDKTAPQGGIIEVSAPVHISNVSLVCKHCSKTTRAGVRRLEDGTQERFCKKCNESVDK